MSSLAPTDRALLEDILGMSTGYVLDFSNTSFSVFFADLGIDIYDNVKYPNHAMSDSKANRLRAFWKHADNEQVAKSINALADYVDAKRLNPNPNTKDFDKLTNEHVERLHQIAKRINTKPDSIHIVTPQVSNASVAGDNIKIGIHAEIYEHIKIYLDNKDYFHAVEESFKVIREKLRDITGHERAHEAFSSKNYVKVFGHEPTTEPEKDFFEGIKFLHMAIQKFRNEKAHTLAGNLEPNLAIHYIALASLAYDLITRDSGGGAK
jgi:uncharacterized protein (TIGR02391 family)